MENFVFFNKNGNKIHIKKENKGKFTSYCGGKVTDECIKKGKNSSNPKIRKMATFAQNSRKWKHRFGGQLLKAQEGSKIDYTQLAKIGANALFQGISTAKQNKAIDQQINALRTKNKADKQQDWLNNYQAAIEQANREAEEQQRLFNENSANGQPSSIVTAHNAYEKAKAFSNAGAIDRQIEQDIVNLQYQKNQNTSDTMSNIVSGLSNWGINYLSNNWQSNKNKAPVTTTNTTNFWTTPNVTASQTTNQFTTNSALNNSNTFWNL